MSACSSSSNPAGVRTGGALRNVSSIVSMFIKSPLVLNAHLSFSQTGVQEIERLAQPILQRAGCDAQYVSHLLNRKRLGIMQVNDFALVVLQLFNKGIELMCCFTLDDTVEGTWAVGDARFPPIVAT